MVPSTGAPQAAANVRVETAKERIEIKEFADLPRNRGYVPTALAAGPDGAVWVIDTSQQAQKTVIVRIAPSGKRTKTFTYGNGYNALFGITTGPDGALWMTDYYDQLIVRMTTSGKTTTFPGAVPVAITSGSDGALWTTMGPCCYYIGGIARLSTQGELNVYDSNLPRYTITTAIAAGSDGALWFTELGPQNGIGRITTSGVITNFTQGITGAAMSIAPGPDGALWFTEPDAGAIGRITTDGHVSQFSRGITRSEGPRGIAAGPDGAMWFTECESDCGSAGKAKIGRITMSGQITEYSNLTRSSHPTEIVQGPDGNMWFLEENTNRVARIRIVGSNE